MTEDGGDHRLLWLLDRVDRRCVEAVEKLLVDIAEQLSIATWDAVTVRVLSDDGASLLPLAAHHPSPELASAMAVVMTQTQPATSGLWRPVVETARPIRWHTPQGVLPAEAGDQQNDFLTTYPVRAVMAVPVLVDERLVGGVSVVRFNVDREFTDADEALVVACASRIGHALDFRSRLRQQP